MQIIGKWPRLENLTFTNNDLNMPFLDGVTISGSQASMAGSANYLLNLLTVPVSSTLNIEPGVSVYLVAPGEIIINGSLKAIGAADKPINFLSYSTSTYWKNLKFSNSTSVLDYVNFRRGNALGSNRESGTILANNSNLTITNAAFLDSDWYGNNVRAVNSVLNISNTTIDGFIKHNNNYGISIFGGVLRINNVNFRNLYVGVEANSPADSLPVLEKENMSADNFVNVDRAFWPFTWWNSASSTSP